MSEYPEVQWALDLLKPDPNYEESFLQKHVTKMLCVSLGFASMCFRNTANRRPFYAGIQGHFVAMAVGYVMAHGIDKYVHEYHADRDTKLRDYIKQHPELFPEPERVKYSKVLNPWTPVR